MLFDPGDKEGGPKREEGFYGLECSCDEYRCSCHKKLKDTVTDLELVRRGIALAESREKHPSFRMELQAVLQVCDDVVGRLKTEQE
jgi:hypothetical protein